MITNNSSGGSTNDQLALDIQQILQKNTRGMSSARFDYTDKYVGTNGDFPQVSHSESYAPSRLYQRRQCLLTGDPLEFVVIEISFDGKYFWTGNPHPGKGASYPASLGKHDIGDISDPSYTLGLLQPLYLDCAGFYAPTSMVDIAQTDSIESLVLRYLHESDSTTIEIAGDYMRITVRIPDQIIAPIQ
jgi:hypothetical protein